MRKNLLELVEVKQRILALKGSAVKMSINRGRKRIETFDATIDSVYPSVFTVKVDAEKQQQNQTFSYFDILCGNVVIN